MIFDEIWRLAMAAQFSLKLHRNMPHRMGIYILTTLRPFIFIQDAICIATF